MIERGYQGTSIDAIAARAGVGRPTIYRRWRTKAHIIHDAVYPTIEPMPLDPAEITEHVAALVAGAYALFGTPAARAGVPGLMSDTRSDPELRKRLVTEQLGPVREVVGGLIADASATGAIRPGVDVDTIVDVLAGAAIFALSVRDAELTDDLVEQMTELIVHGIMPGD
ncbi:MAG: TetR/AcrR family transcriptional regulator [Tomitella sp.]|nr:TetR/AcrR family transcriptional regulator [Tomitella sp.]